MNKIVLSQGLSLVVNPVDCSFSHFELSVNSLNSDGSLNLKEVEFYLQGIKSEPAKSVVGKYATLYMGYLLCLDSRYVRLV